MNCPICDDVKLREVQKNDVMIDICPSCKGVWLDRGELDKLMQGIHETHAEYDELQRQAGYGAYPPNAVKQAPRPSYPQHQSYQQPAPPMHQQYEPNGYNQSSNPYAGYKNSKYKYDKYGRPYKKKKTVFDVFEDLFD